MSFRMGDSMEVQVDMYAGGAVMAAVGHYSDQAAPISFLSKYNITNGEALFAADIIGTALMRKKLRGHAGGMADAAVAYSAGALVDRFLKGRFTTTTTAAASSQTGWEVDDPALGAGWGDGSAPAVRGQEYQAPASYDSGEGEDSFGAI